MCKACRETTLLAPREPVIVAHLALHAHTCGECGLLRSCHADPCPARGRGNNVRAPHKVFSKPWICSACVEASVEAELEAA